MVLELSVTSEDLGRVSEVWIGQEAKGTLVSVDTVRAVAGRGLEGDRYFRRRGSFNQPKLDKTGRSLTLIAREAIEACQLQLAAELGERILGGGDMRRNLVTEGVELGDLVGATFKLGDVLVTGVRLCPPCRLLQRLVGVDVMSGLAGRGGLRAEIIESGEIRVGDAVTLIEPRRGRLPA